MKTLFITLGLLVATSTLAAQETEEDSTANQESLQNSGKAFEPLKQLNTNNKLNVEVQENGEKKQ